MESVDSSPYHIKATKKQLFAGGSECEDDMISVSSSCGSVDVSAVKYRTSNKKILRKVGSYRRRAKSRIISPSVETETASSKHGSLVDEFEASPHYLKATTCSEGKKSNLQSSGGSYFDKSEQNSSQSSVNHGSLEIQSRTSLASVRNVGILLRKTSFKPKRPSLNYSRVAVDRATYSSTLKDSQFPKPVEIHTGDAELEKNPAMKVCRYHHCSLHGHHHGTDDSVLPQKRFQYKRRWPLKKQKSIVHKSDPGTGTKHSSGGKKNLQKDQMISVVESVAYRNSSSRIFSCVENENSMDSKDQPFGGGYPDLKELGLMEIAFGETSFPERSYHKTLNILMKHSPKEQDYERTASRLDGYCLKCSSNIREQIMPPPESTDINFSPHQATDSSLGNGYSHEIDGEARILDTSSQVSGPVEESGTFDRYGYENEGFDKVLPATPLIFDKATKNVSSSASDGRTVSECSSELDVEITTESIPIKNSKEILEQVQDSETHSPITGGGKLQFTNQRHMSMWQIIHHRMASDLPKETINKQHQGGNQENSANSMAAKESTVTGSVSSDLDISTEKDESEVQEIELRKLFAIKLVREAIEKILLPEVQDQTSDDQSVTSQNTPRGELVEQNRDDACIQESYGECNVNKEKSKESLNSKERTLSAVDAPGPGIMKSGKWGANTANKKAPKHWSNLKKWILLQRFIKALEKVRKFNPRKPHHLPLDPDSEAEKVKLRAQTVGDRKNAEEWMLDYALRQAVGQLAPTQKKKVALLVKAFETVVPSEEDPQIQFRVPKLEDKNAESVSEDGSNNEVPSGGKDKLANADVISSLEMGVQESQAKLADKSENASDLIDELGETNGRKNSKNSMLSSTEKFEESERGNSKPTFRMQRLIADGNEKSTSDEDCFSSASYSDLQPEKMMKDKNDEQAIDRSNDGLQEGTTRVDNKPDDALLDNQNRIKMWHMIYQHVVSGIAEKAGSRILDASDDEVEDSKSPSPNSNDFSKSEDLNTENHVSGNQKIKFTKIDALRLIKDAVDEILLRETPDDCSDTQSPRSSAEEGNNSSEHEILVNKEETSSADDIVHSGKDRGVESPMKNKFQLQKSKNWSKLKKLMLLKRSINALQIGRKLEPQSQSRFPQTPDSEPEKIDLRNQMTDERKKAEQWMLDYAVQNIVSKLTPARKRRVSMLVEAFEAVVPLPEI